MNHNQQYQKKLSIASLTALGAFADVLAPLIGGGELLMVSGRLGAGKTTLARAILCRLMGGGVPIPSPSFALFQPYESKPAIAHIDLYRIGGAGELAELGVEEWLADGGACIIEWPENAGGFLDYYAPQSLWIGLEMGASAVGAGEERVLSIAAPPVWAEKLEGKL